MNKQQDVMAILKLYELRRDERMREARQWYFSDFAPQSAIDVAKLYRAGERASAHFRTVVSYWDMAASFVLNGAIDEKLFLDANSEHLFVYAKIAPFLGEIRQLFGEPDYLIHLETLVQKTPDLETKLETRKRLISIWTKKSEEFSAESD
jgi:hypothetical protein